MAIILFLMDTSGSMNQRTCFGPTYLDYGKIAVENFLKIRSKDAVNWKDRYMLVTCEEFPTAIKVGCRDVTRDAAPNAYFKEQLSRLVATSMTNLGGAIKCSLDLLNIHRVQNGLDNYGQGRNPFLMEPAVVVIISDGCKLTNTQTVTDTLTLPMHPSFPGSELTKDPFRWDQRIFSVVLRFKGNVDNDFVDHATSDSQINAMCEVTGGRSYTISSSKSLIQALESINQKVLNGVVIQLEHLPADAERNLAAEVWRVTRRMILVNKTNSAQLAHWPIPENFWPTRDARPIRTAIPLVYFSSESKRVNVLDNLPFDKYELEPSPLTQHILEMRQPTICWQTFVKNSGKEKGIKGPFGYLKASVKGTCVNLFVMPYNYPVLFPLLEELVKELRMQPTNQWITDFKSYLTLCPLYYYGPLRVALRRIGVPGPLLALIPEGGDSLYFANFIKSLKAQAKTEATRYMDQIKAKDDATSPELDVPRKHVSKHDIKKSWNGGNKKIEDVELVKNPYHAPQDSVLSQLKLLRTEIGLVRAYNTTDSLAEERARFSMPSCKMGQYQDAFAKALRTVDVHQRGNHMFGNPFKLGNSKKQMNNMIAADEVEEVRQQQKVTNRRKQLPLKPFPAVTPSVEVAAVPKYGNNVHSPALPPTVPQCSNNVTPPTPSLTSVSPPPTPPSTPPSNNSWAGTPSDPPKTPPTPLPSPPAEKPPKPISPKLANISPWAFSPTGPDIAASIGSGNEVATKQPTTESVSRKPQSVVKEPSLVSVPVVNPLMKESFLKFTGTDSFIDKKKIKDTFSGGDTNGVSRDHNRPEDTNHKPKKMKLSTSNSDVKRDNKKLKDMVQKELRKPGKNYDPMFQLLNQVKGSTDTKLRFAEELISDAEKFRKKLLIERLKSWQKELANR